MIDETLMHEGVWDGSRSEGPGTRLGLYTLVRRIGEGGFGDVYEAEQEQPVKRRVALKIIKLGMDTREVIARFNVERQALAMMEHPHIARVLDAGATEGGRPYFVMELVDGEPITSYCDNLAMPIEARLALFEQVCAAVQHAHTKGVIHRDLKPGNVLVSTHDGKPYAKVIDFGIAKATSGDLGQHTHATRMDQVMGTPLYMSPEQTFGSADIDTRTDIYSLGVILYELLTGSTPVDRTKLLAVSLADTQRLICETEPPVPSVRLMKVATSMTGTFGFHTSDARSLARKIRGELDWIVMKALEKDRARRYETASAFGADLHRYLDGEPVLAAPPGAGYRLRKFVQRNKGKVAAGSLIAASLIAGIAGFAWQAHIAKARADELEQVSKFQEDMLRQVDPTQAGKLLSDDVQARFAAALEKAGVPAAERASQVAAFAAQWQRVNATDTATHLIDRTILKPAVAAIDKQFASQPVVDASLRQALADLYSGIGQYDEAMPLQQSALATRRRALGNDHPDTLTSIDGLGTLLQAQGKPDAAAPYLREALAARRRVLGEDNPETITSISNMGLLLRDQGKLTEAGPYLRDAWQKRRRVLGEDDPDTVSALSNVAALLVDQGKLGEAEPYLRDVLARLRRVRGEENQDTLAAINNLGTILSEEGKRTEAEPYLREALRLHRLLLGESHPDTLQSLVTLGGTLLDEDRNAEAEPFLREAVDSSRRVLGDDNPNTLVAISLLGRLLFEQGKVAAAEALLAPSEAAARKELGDASPSQFAFFLVSIGRARAGSHEFAAALSELTQAQSIYLKTYGPTDTHVQSSTQAVVDLYDAWNATEPGKGYDVKAAEWKKKLAALGPRGVVKGSR